MIMDVEDYNGLEVLKTIDRAVFSTKPNSSALNSKAEDKENETYKYRYEFTRIWGRNNNLLCFIMFNPSITDNVIIDETTNQCSTIAKNWGYDGIALYNLYAFRTSQASFVEDQLQTNDKHKIAEMVGPKNQITLDRMIQSDKYDKIICAWGNHPQKNHSHIDDFDKRSLNTIQRISKEKLLVLGVTNRQQPNHPRRVPKSITKNDAEKLTQHYIEEIKKS